MAIWEYSSKIEDPNELYTLVRAELCIFCNTLLDTVRPEGTESEYKNENGQSWITTERIIKACPTCVWWYVKETSRSTRVVNHAWGRKNFTAGQTTSRLDGTAGTLITLDVTDNTLPISDIRQYFAARYESRRHISPGKFEEVVASVYRDIGYTVRVTGMRGDGGIDVVLDGSSNSVIGIQVKRYKDKIEASQIREFAGALMLGDFTAGIYVVSSDFTSGATKTAMQSGRRGIPIELINAERFYNALGIAQRNAYKKLSNPTAPFTNIELIWIDSQIDDTFM